jgi:esterase/lipase superfamily enzyme
MTETVWESSSAGRRTAEHRRHASRLKYWLLIQRFALICLKSALVALSLAGCAGRPGPEALNIVPDSSLPAGARAMTVYVATTRDRADPHSDAFTNGRAASVNYARYRIAVPPTHKPGAIEWAKATPDPRTDFVTLDRAALDRAQFDQAVVRDQRPAKREVVVFVHGFNNSFQEALFRLVQIMADSNGRAVPVLFAWPSEAGVTGYIADKDAATASRDGLVDVLTRLAGSPQIGKITLVGHSMGAWLSAEALRQLRLMKRDAVLRRLDVYLAAPDIDVDVFRAQLAVIGPLSPPMTLLVSKDDLALSVSSFLSGERQRLGALDVNDPRIAEAARQASVQIVDISGLAANDGLGHGRFTELATLVPKMGIRSDGPDGGLRRAGAFVFDAVGATLSSPFQLAGRAIQRH